MPRSLLTLALLLTAVAPALAGGGPARKPNILVLVADDLGYADVGVHGCKDVPTPHIDSIARHGVRCTAGYVSAPVCSPTRAGLLTGRYQQRFGHELNPPGADTSTFGLPTDQTTLAQALRAAGYVTGHIGKWHLGNTKMPQFAPKARGFDESAHFPGQKKLPPLNVFRHGVREPVKEYMDDAVAREAGGFFKKHRGRPWFLYVAYTTVHQPMEPHPELLPLFEKIADPLRRQLAGMLAAQDRSVGRILEALRATGQEDDTVVVYLSDNGAPPRNGSRNTPFRGTKGTLYEGGVRVPFLIQWKGVLPAGKTFGFPVIQLDLFPTFLAAAGAEAGKLPLDGVSLLPYLRGEKAGPPHQALFWRYGDQFAVRAGDWKLVRATSPGRKAGELPVELYNLAADPGEATDVAAGHPDRVRTLRALYAAWDRQNVPPAWGDKAP